MSDCGDYSENSGDLHLTGQDKAYLMPKVLGFKSVGSGSGPVDELPTPTPRELAILKVLWARGPSSVREVHQELARPGIDSGEALASNTVQTMLRLMELKGLVTHHLKGRSFIYTPLFTREETASRFLDRVFDGAASLLMQSLLEAERIPSEELERMHALIAEARRQRSNS